MRKIVTLTLRGGIKDQKPDLSHYKLSLSRPPSPITLLGILILMVNFISKGEVLTQYHIQILLHEELCLILILHLPEVELYQFYLGLRLILVQSIRKYAHL